MIKLSKVRFKVLNRLSKKYKDTFKLPRVSKVDHSYIRQYENNLDFLWFDNKLKFLLLLVIPAICFYKFLLPYLVVLYLKLLSSFTLRHRFIKGFYSCIDVDIKAYYTSCGVDLFSYYSLIKLGNILKVVKTFDPANSYNFDKSKAKLIRLKCFGKYYYAIVLK